MIFEYGDTCLGPCPTGLPEVERILVQAFAQDFRILRANLPGNSPGLKPVDIFAGVKATSRSNIQSTFL